MMEWIIAAIAVVGVVLNVRKKWHCFLCWMATNAFWFVHNITIGEYAQAVTFAVFFAVSLYGIHAWRKCRVKDDNIKKTMIEICLGLLGTKVLLEFRDNEKISIRWIIDKAADLLRVLKDGKENTSSVG